LSDKLSRKKINSNGFMFVFFQETNEKVHLQRVVLKGVAFF
jgi:hypothetical protein